MTPARILVSTFGSAGDLFPLIPVVTRLRSRGNEVRLAVPRSLMLYLRAAGLTGLALGDGTELRVLEDDRILTTRFDGWASWRWTATDYVLPALHGDVRRIERAVDRWSPDVVVTSGFAVAARVAAARRGVPCVDLSIYPQHGRLSHAPGFGRDLVMAVADILGGDARDEPVAGAAWGVSGTRVLLHDPALLDDPDASADAVGFPYWDGGPARAGDLDRAQAWLDGPSPTVLITLGSFLGAHRGRILREAVDAVGRLGVRALVVGPTGDGADRRDAGPGVRSVGFVPLCALVGQVDAVVHHGGIGTMFAAVRAGRPAVVIPQAFDQAYNARLLERSGAGIDGRRDDLAALVGRLLSETSFTERARAIASALVPAGGAAENAADRVSAAAVTRPCGR